MASYEFSSKPRPVKIRSKFRPDVRNSGAISNAATTTTTAGEPFLPVNIHHDPRVARGNTFAGDTRRSEPGTKTSKGSSKRSLARARSARSSSSSLFGQSVSRPTSREEMDLSRYLVEPGEDSVRPEHEADTQTDEFEDRPQTPDFVPKKTGVDVCTQIEISENLFDLEREIQPLLDVLVGKTIEQARIEVERENELECIREAAATLNREREDEALRIFDLKQAAVLAEHEKEELRQRRRREAAERWDAKHKVACLQLMRQVLPLSMGRVFEELSSKSWMTPTVHQIQTEFLPWLFERVADDVDQRSSVRDTVSGLLESVADAAETARSTRTEARREGEETRQKAASIARARIIQLFLPITLIGEEDGGTRLGPVSVKAGDTVQSAEAKVATWLREEGKVEDVSQPEGGFFAGYLREARRTGGTVRVGKTSMLLELQERVGVSDEILLEVAADS